MLDIKTLIIGEMIVSLLLWAILVFYRKNQKTYDGFGQWANGTLLIAVGYLTFILRPLIPLWISVVLSNGLFILAAIVRLDGTSRFVKKQKLNLFYYLITVVVVGILLLNLFVFDNIAFRGLIFSIAMFSILILTASFFLEKEFRGNRLFIAIGIMIGAWGILLLFRGILWMVYPDTGIFENRFFNSIYFLAAQFLNFGTGISFLLINSQRLENELKDTEERFRLAVQSVADVVFDYNIPDGTIWWSEKIDSLLGYDHGEFPRTIEAWEGILHEDDRARINARLEMHLSAQQPYGPVEYRVRKKDRQVLYWLVNNHTVFSKQGKPLKMIGACTDITEQKKLAEKVYQIQKYENIGMLAGGIAHDFNNILTSILGNVELAMMETGVTLKTSSFLKSAENGCEKAALLVKQILDYSGRGAIVLETINLNYEIPDILKMIETSIPENVTVQFSKKSNLPSIQADASQIKQVIMNLVYNSIEAIFKKTDGIVNISTGSEYYKSQDLESPWTDKTLTAGDYVYVNVTDNGCGMDEKAISKIFDPFYTTKFIGRGLGLSAVLGIVRGHKGAIKVSSNLSQGTSISIFFPASVNSEPIATAEPVNGLSGSILIIDDDEDIVEIGSKMTETIEFEPVGALSGNSALAIFRKAHDEGKSFNCVLLDMIMPGMNGDDVIDELINIDPDVKVIIISGYSEEEMLIRFNGKKIHGFLQKPFKYGDFKDKIMATVNYNKT